MKKFFIFVRAVHQMFCFGKNFGDQHKESLKSPPLYNIQKCYISRDNITPFAVKVGRKIPVMQKQGLGEGNYVLLG